MQRFGEKWNRRIAVVDEHGTQGPRLVDDAVRLWRQHRTDLSPMNLVAEGIDVEALELACYSLQLPLRRPRNACQLEERGATLREPKPLRGSRRVAAGMSRRCRMPRRLPGRANPHSAGDAPIRLPMLDEAVGSSPMRSTSMTSA